MGTALNLVLQKSKTIRERLEQLQLTNAQVA
jgi:hypothetical protein